MTIFLFVEGRQGDSFNIFLIFPSFEVTRIQSLYAPFIWGESSLYENVAVFQNIVHTSVGRWMGR